jgi:hypothetical protein
LRAAGWQGLPDDDWPADVYVAYLRVVDRWCIETSCPRADLIEQWLYERTKSSRAVSSVFTAPELSAINRAMLVAVEQSPDLAAQKAFRTARATITMLSECGRCARPFQGCGLARTNEHSIGVHASPEPSLRQNFGGRPAQTRALVGHFVTITLVP